MPLPPIGVANSISFNFQYDPLDTLDFAKQGKFDIVQIFLSESLLDNPAVLKTLQQRNGDFEATYYHAEGFLNSDFLHSPYRQKLYQFLEKIPSPRLIIHFDESEGIDRLMDIMETLGQATPTIYLENYFQNSGRENTEKNLKKYLALFTLSGTLGSNIFPVLDIPRLFHAQRGLSPGESLEWTYQMINYFSNRQVPLLLHLIDASSPEQSRPNYTAIGSGHIPYAELFVFIRKTRPVISGIILEFEDKINPLTSREYLRTVFANR